MMKINIEQVPIDKEEKIIIQCHEINDEILALMKKIQDNKMKSIVGLKEERIYQIQIKDILYIESNDNKTFIYCEADYYENKLKLYEIENIVLGKSFFRSSKSTIINYAKIDCVSPYFNGRFIAKLTNGEKLIISRQYVPNLKKILGI